MRSFILKVAFICEAKYIFAKSQSSIVRFGKTLVKHFQVI